MFIFCGGCRSKQEEYVKLDNRKPVWSDSELNHEWWFLLLNFICRLIMTKRQSGLHDPAQPTADRTQSHVSISEALIQQRSREIGAGQEPWDAGCGIEIFTPIQTPLPVVFQTLTRRLTTPVLSAVFTEAELDAVDCCSATDITGNE